MLNGGPVAVRMHLDHCLETLRLAIMCNADTTPVLLATDPTEHNRVAGVFESHHKCSKFDKLADWTAANQISEYHVN